MDRLTWTCATATGARNRNEDSFRWRHAPSLALDGDHPVAVVCDGLGGHAHGEVASNTAADAFMQAYLTGGPAGATVPERLLAAVHAANDAIRERCEQDPKLYDMGTTLTAAVLTAEGLWRINVGDSPLHVWSQRNGELRQLSRRHNVAGHPNRLSSALQGFEIAEIDAPVHAAPLREDDAVILASDGLDTLSAETISGIAAMDASLPSSNLAWSLIEAVIAAGKEKQDNTTAACLRIPEGHRACTRHAVRCTDSRRAGRHHRQRAAGLARVIGRAQPQPERRRVGLPRQRSLTAGAGHPARRHGPRDRRAAVPAVQGRGHRRDHRRGVVPAAARRARVAEAHASDRNTALSTRTTGKKRTMRKEDRVKPRKQRRRDPNRSRLQPRGGGRQAKHRQGKHR